MGKEGVANKFLIKSIAFVSSVSVFSGACLWLYSEIDIPVFGYIHVEFIPFKKRNVGIAGRHYCLKPDFRSLVGKKLTLHINDVHLIRYGEKVNQRKFVTGIKLDRDKIVRKIDCAPLSKEEA